MKELAEALLKHNDELNKKYEQLHINKAVKYSDVKKLILSKIVMICKNRKIKYDVDWNNYSIDIGHKDNGDSDMRIFLNPNDDNIINIEINIFTDDEGSIDWNIDTCLISDPCFDPEKIVGLIDLAYQKKTEHEKFFKELNTSVQQFLGKCGTIK